MGSTTGFNSGFSWGFGRIKTSVKAFLMRNKSRTSTARNSRFKLKERG